MARANDVVLLGMLRHMTHILQPLEVKVNGPLKSRFSTLATDLGFANPDLTIGKADFPVVLRHTLEKSEPASVKEAFVATGIVPYNPEAIDKSQWIPATFTKKKEHRGPSQNPNA
ncbi:uncharacterized protein LOC128552860 [Mercenaria mercenaria]|uniref:uncharacterized protein LOC128552860 n=1 Tax=Mercenaria mercenaria TaxID=6596 RepID=UPI00234ED185|nr:uncharacterized protein LOC128552860 [Mercenaria mercenaria]